MRMLDYALELAAGGYRVFPLLPYSKRPATKNGCKDATSKESQIRVWWDWSQHANIGVATDGDPFIVIDADTDGAIDWLRDTGLEISTRTGRGYQTWARMPGGHRLARNSASKLFPGIDVRGAGGYVVAPPSVHPSGALYTWLRYDALHSLQIVPTELAELISPAPRPREPAPPPVPRDSRRDVFGFTRYGLRALERECGRVMGAAEGTRNQALAVASFAMGQLVGADQIRRDVAVGSLRHAAQCAGLPVDEIDRTVDRLIDDGIKKPRYPRGV